MTTDRAFYERRLREELQQAAREKEPVLQRLHQSWADLYRKRLDRLRRAVKG